VIRNIRLLGAALGGLVGLALSASSRLFEQSSMGGTLLEAWIVVGFAILPYLTVVPAGWLIRQAQQLSTAEFVTAVVGLLLGLLISSSMSPRCFCPNTSECRHPGALRAR
jgi:uncharacterized membrane protein